MYNKRQIFLSNSCLLLIVDKVYNFTQLSEMQSISETQKIPKGFFRVKKISLFIIFMKFSCFAPRLILQLIFIVQLFKNRYIKLDNEVYLTTTATAITETDIILVLLFVSHSTLYLTASL